MSFMKCKNQIHSWRRTGTWFLCSTSPGNTRSMCWSSRKGQLWWEKLFQRICSVFWYRRVWLSAPPVLWMNACSLPCYTQHLYCVQSLLDFILFQTLIWIFPDAFCVCVNVPFLMHRLFSACKTGSDCHTLSARKSDRLYAILLY